MTKGVRKGGGYEREGRGKNGGRREREDSRVGGGGTRLEGRERIVEG